MKHSKNKNGKTIYSEAWEVIKYANRSCKQAVERSQFYLFVVLTKEQLILWCINNNSKKGQKGERKEGN